MKKPILRQRRLIEIKEEDHIADDRLNYKYAVYLDGKIQAHCLTPKDAVDCAINDVWQTIRISF